MYAAIRPALRASTRSPARFIRGRRYPSPHRTRSFHATRSLAQDPIPPAGTESRPADSNGAEEKGEKTAAAQTDVGVAAEDAEDLAQKLQRSREMTRRYSSALRRTQRRNRAQDLPPVVVPDWFLKRNVFCLEEVRDDAATRGARNAITLSLQRRESDETSTCTIPLSRPSAGVKLLTQFLWGAWDTGLNAEQKRRFARQLASTLGAADDEHVVQALEQGEDMVAEDAYTNGEKLYRLLGPLVLGRRKLEDRIADLPVLRDAALSEKVAEWQRKFRDTAHSIDVHCEALGSAYEQKSVNEVPPYVLAEIRATIAASLSALQPASTNIFPSAKTNLVLHCPSNDQEKLMTRTVMSTASELGAEVVVLHAQDLAELGGDYLSEGSEPSPHSIRSMGYETYRANSQFGDDIEDFLDPLADDQDDAAPSPFPTSPSAKPAWGFQGPGARLPTMPILAISAMSKALADKLKFQMPVSDGASSNESQTRVQTQAETQLEDLKLANLLDSLIDSTETKRSHGLIKTGGSNQTTPAPKIKSSNSPPPAFFNPSMPPVGDKIDLATALPSKARPGFDLAVTVEAHPKRLLNLPNSKIIYIKDFRELNATQYGGRVVEKLEEIVRKRRTAGESIMIVGSTCSEDLTPELSAKGFQSLQSEDEADFFRTIVVPVESAATSHDSDIHPVVETKTKYLAQQQAASITNTEKRKFRAINLRHIQDMLRCLDPVASRHTSDRESSLEDLRTSASLFPEACFWKVLSYDEVHRIALTALGLHITDTTCDHLKWTHVALAMSLLKVSDEAKTAYARVKIEEQKTSRAGEGWQKRVQEKMGEATAGQSGPSASRRARDHQMERISMTANKHEKRLMPGIANPEQIKTTFDQVHVAPETVDSIRTLTSMSFLRPDAFSYGVLATEKISGALLYGPPGTGKTMLAKAVAKESGCAVLEVSGSSIMDKYVGEGEKNVTAVFSLARKMSPCIVFLDEADAIFSSRDVGRERSSHRDILNQFLKEWDGLNDLSVFVMVATNRPFDLDDAVIRRLPRRLLVDLPTQADRHEILKIHLRGEQLDGSVDLDDIAKRTPFYSGSDLKNLAVSAALACVKEENEQAAIAAAAKLAGSAPEGSLTLPVDAKPPQLSRDLKYDFPETRVLFARHFEKALQEISASISEDMSSLSAIKKFDEKYGDKKGKKKKRVFGIGLNAETNESAARVRP